MASLCSSPTLNPEAGFSPPSRLQKQTQLHMAGWVLYVFPKILQGAVEALTSQGTLPLYPNLHDTAWFSRRSFSLACHNLSCSSPVPLSFTGSSLS